MPVKIILVFICEWKKLRTVKLIVAQAKVSHTISAQQLRLRRKRELRLAVQIAIMCSFFLSVSV
jgi:hypothetical protein